ncbi:MAG: aminotransferase class IV [Nocardiopsaceae bacterium]|nr:aminotransferase class IV [Nocardiopsaceae bacterium]
MNGEKPSRRAAGESLLMWHGADAGFRAAREPGEVRVIDSWLVDDGRVRAFGAHERRFGAAIGTLAGIDRERTREFLLAAMARVPAGGRWFPRVELADVAGSPRLRLRIRPAPPQGHSVRLWVSPSPDARANPEVKGSGLDWLSAQREAAVAAGADEAVLLDADGRVLEGTATSILWWHGDTLCAPPEDGRLLPGITRELLLDAADAAGVPVSFRAPLLAELDGLEVWAVNALHGIRPATAWVGTGIAAGPALRALRWQVYLDGLGREVRPGPAEAVP